MRKQQSKDSRKACSLEKDIEAYLSWLKEDKDRSPATLAGYRYDLTYLLRRCEKLGIEDIRETGDVLLQLHFQQRREEGASESTIAREMTSVRGFYRYWYRQGKIEHNYADILERPKFVPASEEVLTEEETEKLLQQPDETSARGIRDRAILELLCGAGLKTGELLALQMQDMDLQAGCVTVRGNGSKTAAVARIVPLSRRSRAALLTYQRKVRCHYTDAGEEGPEDDALFITGENGKPLSRQAIWQMASRYGAQAGIDKKLSPAMLRRSFAKDLERRGADPGTIQEILGQKVDL